MFENTPSSHDEMIDTFTKYQPLLTEYVDDLVLKRGKARKHMTIEDKKKLDEYKEISLENPGENYEFHLKSKIFEGAIAKSGEKIFGKNARVIPTSEYDDWVNKTDMILEGKDEKEAPVHIAIDATFCKDSMNAERKNGEIYSDIERLNETKKGGNERFHIKYFTSETAETPTELHGVPRVIIGVHSDRLEEILSLIRKGETSHLRTMFLNMIKAQLENQFVFALGVNGEKKDKEDPKTYKKRLPEPIRKEVKSVYPLCLEAVKSDWEEKKVRDLFSSFEKNKNLFALKQFSIPEYFRFLSNVNASWNWISKELDTVKEKEKSAAEHETEVEKKLQSHMEKDRVLKHRPFLA